MQEPFQYDPQDQHRQSLLNLAKKLGGERFLWNISRICYRLRVEGSGTIPLKRGFLVVFNQVSDIADGLIYLLVHRLRPDLYMVGWSLGHERISGALAALGVAESWEQLLETDMRSPMNVITLMRIRQVLLKGGCVMISPEGEKTWDGHLQSPFAPGVAWLALHTAVPIIPIVSRGGYDVQPLWQKEKIHLTGKIRIHIGEPIILSNQPLDRVSTIQVQTATQQIFSVMKNMVSG
jgi:1-acyl-sn-glycerol-3-phosphate acyltransferase